MVNLIGEKKSLKIEFNYQGEKIQMNGTFPVLVRLIHSNNLLCPLMNLLIANSKSSLNGFRCCKSLLELELAAGPFFG